MDPTRLEGTIRREERLTLDALRLDNSIVPYGGIARCSVCEDWGEAVLMLREKRLLPGGLITSKYTHFKCMVLSR